MTFLLRCIDGVSGLSGRIAAWIIAPLIFASVYEVAARYLFNAPTIWAFEVAYMAMGVNFMLGAAYALREDAHVRIDVVYTNFSPRLKALVDAVGYGLVFIPIGVWLSYRLGLYAFDAYRSGETSGASAWNPRVWPFRAALTLGFALLTLQAVAQLLRALRVLSTGGAYPAR